MRTVKVTGKGQIRVTPDTTRVTVTLSGVYRDYAETLRKSAEETEALKDVLSGFGFERSALKTLRFSVDTEYENYTDKNGGYRRRFSGYRYNHVLKVEFASDNGRLGRILYALAGCSARPELRISYTVSDPEAAKNLLLGKAVTDAREKAGVLAGAAGVALGDIQSVDYSWGELDLELRPMNGGIMMEKCMAASDEAGFDLDIEPDDIEVSDTVTVVWEIANGRP